MGNLIKSKRRKDSLRKTNSYLKKVKLHINILAICVYVDQRDFAVFIQKRKSFGRSTFGRLK